MAAVQDTDHVMSNSATQQPPDHRTEKERSPIWNEMRKLDRELKQVLYYAAVFAYLNCIVDTAADFQTQRANGRGSAAARPKICNRETRT